MVVAHTHHTSFGVRAKEEELSACLACCKLCAVAPISGKPLLGDDASPLKLGQPSGGTILGPQSEILFPPSMQ